MTSGGIRPHGFKRAMLAALAGAFALFGGAAMANPKEWQLNMTRGASEWSSEPYFLNNVSLGVCVVIGILVFGAMFIAMFRFRKSRGAVAEKWSHNTMLEIVWTTIPVIILIVLAYLATGGLTSFANTTGSQMTVKVTGYQWKWRYDYVDYQGKAIDKVGFMSKLDDAQQRDPPAGLGHGSEGGAGGRREHLPAGCRQAAGGAGRHQDPLRDHRAAT